MVKALEAILGIEVVKAVLKRILDIAALVEDLVVAARAMDVFAQQRDHIIHHLLVAGEDDVRTAGIVGEALLLNGLAVPAAAAFLFQDFAVLFQMGGDADTRQAAA
jgi:hypothetical protein